MIFAMRMLFCLNLAAATLTGLPAMAEEAQKAESEVMAPVPPAPPAATGQRSFSHVILFPQAHQYLVQITPTFTSLNQQATGKFSGNTFKQEEFEDHYAFAMMAPIGMSDWAVEIGSSFGNGTTNITWQGKRESYSTSGVSDLNIKLVKIQPLADANIFFGLQAETSIDEAQVATADRSGNFSSGGLAAKPFMTYEAKTSFGATGTTLAYRFRGPRQQAAKFDNAEKVNIKTYGQNELQLSFFVERVQSNFAWGALAGITNIGSGWKERSDEYGRSDKAGTTLANLDLYAALQLSRQMSLTPRLFYQTALNRERNNFEYSRNDTMGGALSALLAF